MLPANIELVTKENFEHSAWPTSNLVAVFGLDKRADHRSVQNPHQVGHEHEPILKDGQGVDCLPAIIVRNLPRHFLQALLNLLSGNHRTKLANQRTGRHRGGAPPVSNAFRCPAFYRLAAPGWEFVFTIWLRSIQRAEMWPF